MKDPLFPLLKNSKSGVDDRGHRLRITHSQRCPCFEGKSAIATAGEFELMFTNTEVHKIVRISKTNQDNPNL